MKYPPISSFTGLPQTGFNGRVTPLFRKRLNYGGGFGFPWGADHPWGLVSVSGASVTIAAGEFEAGNGVALATAQTTLTITEDAQYIGLKYDPAAGSLSLIAPTTSKPIIGDNVFRTWLYFFSFDGTKASYKKHNLTGNWHAAMFAYEPAP